MKPTQEQVLQWAREAGIPDANIQLIAVGRLETGAELLQAVATLAYEAGRADENEACADLVQANAKACDDGSLIQIYLASNAAAIRARREQ